MPIEKPNSVQGYKPRTLQDVFREMPEIDVPAEMATARSERLQTHTYYLSRSIHILVQLADYPSSMRILEENNLRPLTYKEALAILTENEEIKERLKDKWFWLDGKGSDKDGWYHFDGNGLAKGKVDDIEKNVFCWGGKHILSLDVRADAAASGAGGRFILDAYLTYAPAAYAALASAIVGVPK